ncbi:MFS transporter, partial [Acinetobacter baumannii]|nr:MFS transporter [Acinetobacter baumannii]
YAFIIGALPALYVFFIRLHMPESVRYLLSKGKVEEAQKIVDDLENCLGVKYTGELKAEQNDVPTEKPKLKDLWSSKYLARTIML